MKKHHWHVFRHEKLFEKQPLPHYQTGSLRLGLVILEGYKYAIQVTLRININKNK